MAQNYQKIGDYITVIDNRNSDGAITNLMGISIDKCYIPSVANVIGTDLNNYKVIRKGQFACSLMQVSRDQRIPLAMYTSDEPAIMSPAYVMFEVNRLDEILPEYMELWFKRAEFDREASFYAVGGVRGSLDWEDFCKMKLPVPSISEQRKIVHDYQVITDRIELLRKINKTLVDIVMQEFEQFTAASNGEWVDGKLKDIVYLTRNAIKAENVGSLPYLPIDEIPSNELLIDSFRPSNEAQSSLITFDENDILIGAMRVYFHRVAIAPCKGVTRTTCFVLKPFDEDYLYYALLLCNMNTTIDYANSTSQGTTMPYAIWENGLGDMPIVYPNKESLVEFNKTVKTIFDSIYLYTREISQLNQLLRCVSF